MASGKRPWFKDWGGIVVAGLAVDAAVYLVLQFTGFIGKHMLLSDVMFLPLGFGGAVLAVRAGRHRRLDAKTRRAWLMIGVALAAYFVGDLIWTILENTRSIVPFPSAADGGYIAFYPLLLAGLLMFPGLPRTKTDRTKFGLDLSTVLLGGWMVVWYFVLGPTAIAHQSSGFAAAVSIAYPIGDLVLLFGIAAVMLRRPLEGSRRALAVMASGLLLFVVADLGFGSMSLKDTYTSGAWPDALWMAAQFLFAASAYVAWRHAERDAAPVTKSSASNTHQPRLPYVAVVISFGLLLLVARNQAVYPLGGLLLGAVGVTGLVVWRQIAVLHENATLMLELHQFATTDHLTGLMNRRQFFDLAEREFLKTRRYGHSLTAIMFDIDHFKQINDTYGHDAGDQILRAVAQRFNLALRTVDLLCRYGGDEFVVLLPETGEDGAIRAAHRARTLVRELEIEPGQGPATVTLSVGVASEEGCETLNDLLALADSALYQAKRAGRDCVRTMLVA